ncbi:MULTISPECIES: SAM-dependent methyltransferase [Olivibacter]|uniref:SAM-dependent methyltransferase n=1 Tax=Olivibacter oleidegradans TaxID=760123 RepID=A0ABV6HNB6_9SPHI|nr:MULTISPECIES: class I SAM-dependent methyltransferase [Olivibacter]MDX3914058.1 class I SAM-dependent methyltransferase [Pseudosphingobacterium sp.]QEL02203.1 class I SAM-dependent methyltransferase [Olivibacter sp. LS-1]
MKAITVLYGMLMLAFMVPITMQAQQMIDKDVPYVPTKQEVVEAMLTLANVGPNDMLYDLGCGDGRIVVTAAKKFGAKAVGIDIDPERIQEARENAQKAAVENKVAFLQQDLFKADFSKASVVSLYLLPSVNIKLRPKLLQLKPGTRVVSHAFDMGDWKPDKQMLVGNSTIYLWTVPDVK